jgi:hypothetical protein
VPELWRRSVTPRPQFVSSLVALTDCRTPKSAAGL